MTSIYIFEQERLKPVISHFINSGCDFNAVPLELRKSLRLFVIDNIPYMWLSDGFHFIEALFTKDAVNEFRKNYPHVKFSGLRDKILFVNKWSL